jgi:DNA-binding phage protein
MIEETLRTLLASNEALHVAVSSVRSGVETLQKTVEKQQEMIGALQKTVEKQQESIVLIQTDVAAIKVGLSHCATKAEVEMVRADLYKTLEAQTWKLFTLILVLGSALTTAVYYIARNVH